MAKKIKEENKLSVGLLVKTKDEDSLAILREIREDGTIILSYFDKEIGFVECRIENLEFAIEIPELKENSFVKFNYMGSTCYGRINEIDRRDNDFNTKISYVNDKQEIGIITFLEFLNKCTADTSFNFIVPSK